MTQFLNLTFETKSKIKDSGARGAGVNRKGAFVPQDLPWSQCGAQVAAAPDSAIGVLH